MRRGLAAMVAALLLGVGACTPAPDNAEDQSIVVIYLNLDPSVPPVYQVRVAAHLGDEGIDDTLFFPTTPQTTPIASDSSLALLIPTTHSGLLDLILTGFGAGNAAVASGNDQVTLAVGKRVNKTITLTPCSACN